MSPLEHFAANLETLRAERGWSQEDLSRPHREVAGPYISDEISVAAPTPCRSITGMEPPSTASSPTILDEGPLLRPVEAPRLLSIRTSWVYEAVRAGARPPSRRAAHPLYAPHARRLARRAGQALTGSFHLHKVAADRAAAWAHQPADGRRLHPSRPLDALWTPPGEILAFR